MKHHQYQYITSYFAFFCACRHPRIHPHVQHDMDAMILSIYIIMRFNSLHQVTLFHSKPLNYKTTKGHTPLLLFYYHISMERRFVSCFDNSVLVQKSDLSDLLRTSASPDASEAEMRQVIEQSMKHYEDYSEQRKVLMQEDGAAFFSPPWCPSFENSVLWMGGCRPSLAIRLLYSVTGSEMEAHLQEFLEGHSVRVMGLTAHQLQMVNRLHQRTLLAEDRLTSRLATVQEDVADEPFLPIIREKQQSSSSSTDQVNGGEGLAREVETAMQSYAEGLARLVREADLLRLTTARTLLTEILSPRQAVELLIAGKQLHLSLHECAVKRDRRLRCT